MRYPSRLQVEKGNRQHGSHSAILADYRVHGESLRKRFHGGKVGTLWYYRELVNAFRGAGTHPLIGELDRAVSEIHRSAER